MRALLFLLALALTSSLRAQQPPNIVLFYVDDLGWQDTALPMAGEPTELNRRFRTPNLQRLAAEGVLFTDAHGAAVCSPSRISLMTGMNAARHGVTNWTKERDKSPDQPDQRFTPPAWPLNGLAVEPGTSHTVVATPLPRLLADAGYFTLHVGKAHFAARGTACEDPRALGFAVNVAGHAPGGPGSYSGLHDFSAAWRTNPPDHSWDVPGLEPYLGQDINLTEALTREAIRHLDQNRSAHPNQPFFLYLSHYTVHAPWEIDERFRANYPDLSDSELAFATMVEGMDKSLGDILAWLEAQGVTENTLVVFMSDNGTPQELHRSLPLRGHKVQLYEGGHRVPLVLRWPGHTAAGARQPLPVIVEDLFPTLLAAAGATPEPATLLQTVDGQSILPLLDGAAHPGWAERPLVWHFPHHYGPEPASALRLGPWKLLWHPLEARAELFNLEQDLGEGRDLATSEPGQLGTLRTTLRHLLQERGALMPTSTATGQPLPLP